MQGNGRMAKNQREVLNSFEWKNFVNGHFQKTSFLDCGQRLLHGQTKLNQAKFSTLEGAVSLPCMYFVKE
jgi:hypothetical protein